MEELNPFAVGYVEPVASAAPIEHDVPAPRLVTGVQRMPSADYHSDPAPEPSLSSTLAKLLLTKSPRHAWHACRRLNPNWEPNDRKTFDIGRAAHRAVLGAGDDYVAIPEELLAVNGAASTKEAKAFIANAREAGRTPLKLDEVDQIEIMAAIAHERLLEHGITLDSAQSEISAIARIDGVWCRAMYDNLTPHWIYDFKTCEDAAPEACLRAILNYGYDIQAGHYQAVWKEATGEDRPFVFIFQEKNPPFEVTLVRLSGSFQDMANRRAAKARKLWGECVRSNNWPGYPIGLHEVDPPAWLVEREFQEEM